MDIWKCNFQRQETFLKYLRKIARKIVCDRAEITKGKVENEVRKCVMDVMNIRFRSCKDFESFLNVSRNQSRLKAVGGHYHVVGLAAGETSLLQEDETGRDCSALGKKLRETSLISSPSVDQPPSQFLRLKCKYSLSPPKAFAIHHEERSNFSNGGLFPIPLCLSSFGISSQKPSLLILSEASHLRASPTTELPSQ